MQQLIYVLDALALWITWWCAGAGLVGGHEVRNWRNLTLAVGLAGVTAFAFVGALVMTLRPSPYPLWSTCLRIAVSLVAVGLYEYRFGIGRHLRLLRGWLTGPRKPHNRRPA